MSSDVFILSAAQDHSTPGAMQEAIKLAGVGPLHVQDAIFGLDGSGALADVQPIIEAAGLGCPAACVSTSLRALFFAAASMLSDDTQISLVVGLNDDASTVFVLASPEAVGRMNLLPRARIAARSLVGPDTALRAAELAPADIEITRDGRHAAQLLYDLLDELEAKAARWGMLSVGEALIIVERV